MKHHLSTAIAAAVLALASVSAHAVDFEYFKSQSCAELGKELESLQKAEKAVQESINKKESKANTQAVVTALLVGWPFWGSTDHGDAQNQLAEIRTDVRFVTRAQKANKCS
jgi:5,10-methylene-tetrahydrofolate dehydrogenase/methenyl tetrahydrofolate cyclohydrolase